MIAAANGHEEVVGLLLEAKADVNAANVRAAPPPPLRPPPSAPHPSPFARGAALQGDGWTALMWAAIRGHEEVVPLLLEGGADREAKDRYGLSALDWARRRGHDGAVRLLEVRGRRGVGEGLPKSRS